MCCPVYRLYYHMWGFHLQTKTNETAFQLFGWASVKTCCPLWFRLSVLCIVCTHVHLLVCLHNKERDSNYENTQKKKREWEGKLQMAVLLCKGMLTVVHRKMSQLGEVRERTPAGHGEPTWGRKTSGRTARASAHGRFRNQSQGYSCFVSVQY